MDFFVASLEGENDEKTDLQKAGKMSGLTTLVWQLIKDTLL
jgi:hypothetical protein